MHRPVLSKGAINNAHDANELWITTRCEFLNRHRTNNGIRIYHLVIMQHLVSIDRFIIPICKSLDDDADYGFVIDKEANRFLTTRRFNL
jgi:hypothetical protein